MTNAEVFLIAMLINFRLAANGRPSIRNTVFPKPSFACVSGTGDTHLLRPSHSMASFPPFGAHAAFILLGSAFAGHPDGAGALHDHCDCEAPPDRPAATAT